MIILHRKGRVLAKQILASLKARFYPEPGNFFGHRATDENLTEFNHTKSNTT